MPLNTLKQHGVSRAVTKCDNSVAFLTQSVKRERSSRKGALQAQVETLPDEVFYGKRFRRARAISSATK